MFWLVASEAVPTALYALSRVNGETWRARCSCVRDGSCMSGGASMALQSSYTPTIHARHGCGAGARSRGARAAHAGIALAALASLAVSAAPGRAAAADAVVAQLMARDLIGMPGKEVTMET